MTDQEKDNYYMQQALALARRAAAEGEAPVGAVVVHDGKVIGSGYNLREREKHPLAHAELIAIDMACRTLGGWRLSGCTLYVTLEPCPMCAGGIINARIDRVVFGAADPKAGSFGSLVDLTAYPYNHIPQITGGVLEKQAADLLRDFFRELRRRAAQGGSAK